MSILGIVWLAYGPKTACPFPNVFSEANWAPAQIISVQQHLSASALMSNAVSIMRHMLRPLALPSAVQGVRGSQTSGTRELDAIAAHMRVLLPMLQRRRA